MNHFIKSFSFLVLIAVCSAMTTIFQANAATNVNESIAQPVVIADLKVVQSGPGTITATWITNMPPPYIVTIIDLITMQTVVNQQQVNVNTYTKNGLTTGHHYLVNVQDYDSIKSKFIWVL